MDDIQQGLYQHYKGGIYVVYFTARHSETNEKLVVYRSYEPPRIVWTRPYDMFTSTVTREDGTVVPRFRKLSREEEDAFITQHREL